MKTEDTEADLYRDTYVRYMGYSNEVGEAFRPLIHRNLVNLSYAVAIGYVLCDVYDKSVKVQKKANTTTTDVTKQAADVFIWQMLASVIIPGFTIHKITGLTGIVLKQVKAKGPFIKFIPTTIGLASIPLIIKPIDTMVDILLDNTFRKYL